MKAPPHRYKPKSSVTLQLTLSCASAHKHAFHMWTVFGQIICAYMQFSTRVFVAGNCMANCRPTAYSVEKVREILKREKTVSFVYSLFNMSTNAERKEREKTRKQATNERIEVQLEIERQRVRAKRRNISEEQREKEQERERVNRRSISDKQREKEQERARVNRQSISDKQREKEQERARVNR